MSLLIYTACNDVPTFASTRLLFGNQRQSVGMRLSTHSNFRPFKSSVRPRSRGYSPYTAALHNHQQPAPLRIFPRLYVRTGFLLFIPSFPTQTPYTASTPWEVSVCPFVALPTHLSNTISVVSADILCIRTGFPLTPPFILRLMPQYFRRNVSPDEIRPCSSGLLSFLLCLW